MGRHVPGSVLRARLARSAAVSAVALVGAMAASTGGISPIKLTGPGSTAIGWTLLAPLGEPEASGRAVAIAVEQEPPAPPAPPTRPTTPTQPVPGTPIRPSDTATVRPAVNRTPTAPRTTTDDRATGPTDTGTTNGTTNGTTTGQPVDTGTPPRTLVPTTPDGPGPVTVTISRNGWESDTPAPVTTVTTDSTEPADPCPTSEPATPTRHHRLDRAIHAIRAVLHPHSGVSERPAPATREATATSKATPKVTERATAKRTHRAARRTTDRAAARTTHKVAARTTDKAAARTHHHGAARHDRQRSHDDHDRYEPRHAKSA